MNIAALNHKVGLLAAVLAACLAAGCDTLRRHSCPPQGAHHHHQHGPARASAPAVDPLLPLADGDAPLTREIARLQAALRERRADVAAWEKLGWSFIVKGRAGFDDHFLALAEECSRRIERLQPGAAEGRLLLGHVRHSEHRFAEAGQLARGLAHDRGLPADFGLLGDALMEQGRLAEAAAAYQRMIDLRPDLQSYYRAAHLRWLKGDLDGAIEACRLAARTINPRDGESAAWIHARLGSFQFQAGDFAAAELNCSRALAFQSNYPPALLLQGRLRLAHDDAGGAVSPLEAAARQVPLPEYQWALADALRRAGQSPRAAVVEDDLLRHGAVRDPRTFALFLATRARQADTAVRLATAELRHRADVFTHDAAAWALLRAGRVAEVDRHMRLALAEGTRTARLELHAAAIAARAGRTDEAARRLASLAGCLHELLPSEQDEFERLRHRAEAPGNLSAATP